MNMKKDNIRNQAIKPRPDTIQSHYCESNTGHLSVQTTSPFKMRMKDSEFKTDQKMIGNYDKNTDAMIKKLPNEACSSVTSKLLINQIIRDNNLDGDRLNLNEIGTEKNLRRAGKKSNYNQNFTINHIQYKRSAPTFNCKSSSMQLGHCLREDSIEAATIQDQDSEKYIRVSNFTDSNSIHQKNYAEKTTYCRPTLNFNHDFVNKTAEKNLRLQKLVKKLIIARKKEKESEAWNNYINELKNKHESYSSIHCSSQYVEYIDDYYPESELDDSNTCVELLQDFYLAHDLNYNYNSRSQFDQPVYFRNQSDCYPISSQGRLMMLNKERRRNAYAYDWKNRPVTRPYYGQTIVVDRENRPKKKREVNLPTSPRQYMTESYELKNNSCGVCDACQTHETFSTQTSIINMPSNSNNEGKEVQTNIISDTFKEQYERVSHNVNRLKRKLQDKVRVEGQGVLASIENKIDTLITSLNSFIDEVKSRNVTDCYNCHSISLNSLMQSNKDIDSSKSETFKLVKAERLVCGLVTQNKTEPIPFKGDGKDHDRLHEMNIDEILSEEIDISNKAKEDIENILSGNTLRRCAVQMSLDVPIQDRSTEATDSLPQAILVQDRSVSGGNIVKDVHKKTMDEDKKMTIAVNTDPLGLLALLRISTETVKKFLSYVPNIPYYSYLSTLQSPQIRMQSDYICNICGAAFGRPSQLSDHIQGHELGKTRDCCVCRHILDMQSQRYPGLFSCRYCGQRFTRAYCCELHQGSCAKRLGLKHDVKPSLMLLR